MDSLALRAVYSEDAIVTGQRPRGTDRTRRVDRVAVVTPRRPVGELNVETSTGERRISMDDQYSGGSSDDGQSDDEARRAVQVAMDRRDNGGRS